TRLGALEFLLESRDGTPSEAITGTSRKREGAAVRGSAAGEPLAEVLEVGLPAGGAHRARERVDAMSYLGVGRVVALQAGEQLTGGRGVASPEAHVGEGDPAVVIPRPLLEQPDESALGCGELTGPALQLGDPEPVLEAAGILLDHGPIGGERLRKALLPSELLGLSPEIGGVLG